ncbi:hypothetical protein CERZMDRAFT_97650 [Cercospora zeae-maydis SCOH1-5]|uniref:Uncharacterized protein n=1 Tax=Cercospora zeae-maydis SCOH1-5 TaxID=717836 RepID=A0A6A6FGD0_9PEZI|nr:hypothetical protein CERZMDRAFT_97650 [Cercospora zeae-maydis SCOH1-5]
MSLARHCPLGGQTTQSYVTMKPSIADEQTVQERAGSSSTYFIGVRVQRGSPGGASGGLGLALCLKVPPNTRREMNGLVSVNNRPSPRPDEQRHVFCTFAGWTDTGQALPAGPSLLLEPRVTPMPSSPAPTPPPALRMPHRCCQL